MSMPSFPAHGADMTREEALTMIIASIAMEELALSHIINAEGEKLQYILGTLPGAKPCACPQDVLAVNKSVASLLDVVAQNQMLLKNKLEKVLEVCPAPVPPCGPYPPRPPNPPPRRASPPPPPPPPPTPRPPATPPPTPRPAGRARRPALPPSVRPAAGKRPVLPPAERRGGQNAPSIWWSVRRDICGARAAACPGGKTGGRGIGFAGTSATPPRSGWTPAQPMRCGAR